MTKNPLPVIEKPETMKDLAGYYANNNILIKKRFDDFIKIRKLQLTSEKKAIRFPDDDEQKRAKGLFTALALNELNGGDCPIPDCKRPWAKVTIKEDAYYYQPTCECFPQCPKCKEWYYLESVAKKIRRYDMACSCGRVLFRKIEGDKGGWQVRHPLKIQV